MRNLALGCLLTFTLTHPSFGSSVFDEFEDGAAAAGLSSNRPTDIAPDVERTVVDGSCKISATGVATSWANIEPFSDEAIEIQLHAIEGHAPAEATAAVPEPSCVLLLALAFLSVGANRRVFGRQGFDDALGPLWALILVLLPATVSEAQIEAPPQFGNWTVGHQVLSLAEDDGASRAMDVDLWFPTTVDPANVEIATYANDNRARMSVSTQKVADSGPFSLIVYSHGTGGDSVENSVFAESLASHGFVVAATTHLEGGSIPPLESSTYTRPGDVQSIIDVLLAKSDTDADPLHGTISTEGVGVAGFSFGGFTSMAAAAGTTDGKIEPDNRVKAIMPIARGSFLSEPVSPNDINIPTLLFAGAQDDFGLDDRARNNDLEALSSINKFVAIVDGANHVDVGWTYCQQSPATTACSNDDALEVESILGVSFFDRFVRGNDTFGGVLSQAFALQHESPFEFWSKAITDTNRDKKTDFADFLVLSQDFGKSGRDARRSRADFNDDDLVDFADFLLLAENFSGATAANIRPVPEPTSFALITFASLSLILFRRTDRFVC